MKILIDTSTYPLDDMVDVEICDDSGTVTREYRGKPGGYLYVKTRAGGDWRQVMRAPKGAEHGGGVDGVAVSVPHAREGQSQRAALLGRVAEAVAADLVLGRDGTIAERVSAAFKGSGVTWQIVGARGESLRFLNVVETLSVRRETVTYATPDADAPDATSDELAWVFADGSRLCPYGEGAWDEPDRHPRNDRGELIVDARPLPPDVITDEQIRALGVEAAAAGDLAQVEYVAEALRGRTSSRRVCEAAIRAARAMAD